MQRPYDFQFGTFYLTVGGLLVATFFWMPLSTSIINLADQIWQEGGYTGVGVGMVMIILAVGVLSCYWGLRLLLDSPTSPTTYQAHLVLIVALCFLAEGAYYWLFREIRDLPQGVAWGGYSVGLLINFFILLGGVAHLFLARRRAFDGHFGHGNEDMHGDDMPQGQKRQPTTIEQEIHAKYLAQGEVAWEFSTIEAKKVNSFYPIPYLPQPDDWLVLRTPQRIVLEMIRSGYDDVLTIGLDLYGDVVFGRSKNDEPGRIALDLGRYGGRDLGVTRQHMLLRPATDGIYVVDLGSRYGTTINGKPLDAYTAVLLPGNCVIGLGQRMLFRVTFADDAS